MTILMTRILLSPRFSAGPRQRLAANLAVIAASNVGANYTLIGSLAAVMWTKLLKVADLRPLETRLCTVPAPHDSCCTR
jgi:Na+/H+ antiporter NhaD/arsenite permease-like protein